MLCAACLATAGTHLLTMTETLWCPVCMHPIFLHAKEPMMLLCYQICLHAVKPLRKQPHAGGMQVIWEGISHIMKGLWR